MRHTDRKGGGGRLLSPPIAGTIPARQHTGGMPVPMFQQTFTIPS